MQAIPIIALKMFKNNNNNNKKQVKCNILGLMLTQWTKYI